MEFDCWINAKYRIPDNKVRKVVEQLKADWPDAAEIYPNDLINAARNMGVGRLVYNELDPDVECDEPALQESEIPK